MEAKKTIACYLFLRTISTFATYLIAAYYVVFLEMKGLNYFERNLVNLGFFATLFVFEIPTGAFADVFGRRTSFVLSCFLFSLGMFQYAIAGSFWGFVLAESIAALGQTFASGAYQAWLVDRLKHQAYTGSINRIFSQEQQLRNGTGILAAMIGAYAGSKYISLPWILGGGFMFVAGMLALIFMEEENFGKRNFSIRSIYSMKETVQASASYASKNSAVKFLLFTGLVQFFAIQAPNMQWQPFFVRFVAHKEKLGFIFAAISISLMVGSALAPWLLSLLKSEKAALSVSQFGIGVGMFMTVLCANLWPAMMIFLSHEIARGLFAPLKDAYLNDNIPSSERATLISFESISHHIGGMIGLVMSGFLAQHVSVAFAWIVSGGVLMTFAVLLHSFSQNKLEQED